MAVGEVEILLNGKPETLRSSLDAAKRVNALGGFMNVHAKLQAYDIEASVYKTGLPKLLGDVSTFVNYLANGGKPFTQSGEAEPGEE